MSGFSISSLVKEAGGIALAGVALALFNGWIDVGTLKRLGNSKAEIAAVEQSAYYANCGAARAAGAAPLYRGDAGYRNGMDGDGDGVACEPYRGQF